MELLPVALRRAKNTADGAGITELQRVCVRRPGRCHRGDAGEGAASDVLFQLCRRTTEAHRRSFEAAPLSHYQDARVASVASGAPLEQ